MQSLDPRAFRARGLESIKIRSGLRDLMRHACSSEVDILHLHWVHGPITRKNPIKAAILSLIFWCALLAFRINGKKIVWTVHNLVNHEKKRENLDILNSRIIARLAHRVLIQGESARSVVAETYRISPRKINVLHHGNYEGIVAPTIMARRHEAGVRFLYFGKLRPYKGVINLLESFPSVRGNHRLHIAGEPKVQWLERSIKRLSEQDPERVTLQLRFVPDMSLGGLFEWCDVVVLPYLEILTSGSLLMAMTAGRPVVVPNAGLIPDYVDATAAFLYDPQNDAGLKDALIKATECEELPQMGERAAECARQFDWNRIGADLSAIYRSLYRNVA